MYTATVSKSVLINAQGSIIMQCKKCGMLLADKLMLNGATVKCPYCRSNYHYTVRLEAKAVRSGA
jgi:DNA-directed RNA polymerase subunit RPC12/RpoP